MAIERRVIYVGPMATPVTQEISAELRPELCRYLVQARHVYCDRVQYLDAKSKGCSERRFYLA